MQFLSAVLHFSLLIGYLASAFTSHPRESVSSLTSSCNTFGVELLKLGLRVLEVEWGPGGLSLTTWTANTGEEEPKNRCQKKQEKPFSLRGCIASALPHDTGRKGHWGIHFLSLIFPSSCVSWRRRSRTVPEFSSQIVSIQSSLFRTCVFPSALFFLFEIKSLVTDWRNRPGNVE